MTPLEEQVEKLAREWEKDADVLEGLAPKGTWVNGASTARREDANQLRALLPLEVTDGEARITDEMVEAGAKALLFNKYNVTEEAWLQQDRSDRETSLTDARFCLSAALTQKGDNE